VHQPGGALWPIPAFAVLMLGIGGVVWATQRGEVALLAKIQAAPKATLAQPAPGPALYTGALSGPAGRVDVFGAPAAVTWWWVSERKGKNTYKTVCFEEQIAGIALEQENARARIAVFDGSPHFNLVGNGRTNEDLDDPITVDLAERPYHSSKSFPSAAARCQGENRTFVARNIPPRAPVDVWGCLRDGAFVPCDGPLQIVIAVDGMSHNRSRRAIEVAKPFLVVSVIGLLGLVGLLWRAIAHRERTFAWQRPRGGGEPK